MNTEVADFIEHYGAKGMKWGVKKSQGSTSKGVERTSFAKSPKRLTNAELERRIKRMETEKRYNELNKRDISAGEKMAAEVITNSGKKVATTVLTGAALFGLKKALEKQFGAEVAQVLTTKKK